VKRIRVRKEAVKDRQNRNTKKQRKKHVPAMQSFVKMDSVLPGNHLILPAFALVHHRDCGATSRAQRILAIREKACIRLRLPNINMRETTPQPFDSNPIATSLSPIHQ
jgi:hypothetical protein